MHGSVISRVINSLIFIMLLILALDAAAVGWEERASMADPRQEVAVAELDGRIYVIGGFRPDATVADSVEVYDPVTDSWSFAAAFPLPIHHATAVTVSGKLYVIGGCTSPFVPLTTLYEYDADADAWIQRASMPAARCSMAAAQLDGKIYVAGGSPPIRENDFTVYDPVLDQWSVLPDLPTGRNHLAAGAIDGKFYAIGGRNDGIGGVLSVNEAYDTASGLWTTMSPMPTARGGVAYAMIGNQLIVFGGEGNPLNPSGVFEAVEAYDALTDLWRKLPAMPTPRHGIGAGVVGQSVFMPGGASNQGLGVTGRHEMFDSSGIGDFEGVFCDVRVNQASYIVGEDVIASRVRIANIASVPVKVELKAWYESPAGVQTQVFNLGPTGFLTLQPGIDADLSPLVLFTVSNSDENGEFRFGCRILNQVTGKESMYIEDVFSLTVP